MRKIFKELNVKNLLAIALPISIQSLIQSFLGMIDQVMIGQLGESTVAAVSLGGRPGFILIYTLSGITAAASIFASQYESDAVYATVVVVITTLLSIGTIPLLVTLL